jgi:hypothetical protein
VAMENVLRKSLCTDCAIVRECGAGSLAPHAHYE